MLSRRLKAVRSEPESTQAPVPIASRASAQVGHPTRGTIVGWQRDRGVLVEVRGSKDAVLAQSLVEFTADELDRAAAERRPALLVFESGDRARPVILGLVAPIPGKAKGAPGSIKEHREPKEQREKAPGETLLSDNIVMVRGRDSIEIRCGAASITLQKDGHILVRGKNVTSRASKENRIMGGSVHFN